MIENFKNICISEGLANIKDGDLKILNITERPTQMSKRDMRAFKRITKHQKIMNRLCFNAMHDVHEKIEHPIYNDVLDKIRKIKPEKFLYGIYLRTDYLFEEKERKTLPKQVEINTISCAFVAQGPILNKIHSMYHPTTIISNSDQKLIQFFSYIKRYYVEFSKRLLCLKPKTRFCVLMVDNITTSECANFMEKNKIIFLSKKSNDYEVLHVTFDDIRKHAKFKHIYSEKQLEDAQIEEAFISSSKIKQNYIMEYKDFHVYCVYYRWYYNREHYTNMDIILRAKIECSFAVSVPCVEGQIIGLKIFQFRFSSKDYLQNYITKAQSEKILPLFGEYKNFTEESLKNENLENYVLKSLDEGGGRNLFGKEIVKYAGNMENVFLMKKIQSKSYRNKFFGSDEEIKINPEIGILGWGIGTKTNLITNKSAGYICRSKNVKSNECGVSCGFGALDSLQKDKPA